MMHCGRCGKEIGAHEIEDLMQPLRVTEYARDESGQKFACVSMLCGKCRDELRAWLREGGYFKQRKTWLPCMNRQKSK